MLRDIIAAPSRQCGIQFRPQSIKRCAQPPRDMHLRDAHGLSDLPLRLFVAESQTQDAPVRRRQHPECRGQSQSVVNRPVAGVRCAEPVRAGGIQGHDRHQLTLLPQSSGHPDGRHPVPEVPPHFAHHGGDGERQQVRARGGIEAVDGLDDADARHLKQVIERLPAAAVAARDVLGERETQHDRPGPQAVAVLVACAACGALAQELRRAGVSVVIECGHRRRHSRAVDLPAAGRTGTSDATETRLRRQPAKTPGTSTTCRTESVLTIAPSALVHQATATHGTAIGSTMGLSGAAATSAGLATIGGGSLAAGGFGVAGGTILISGIGGVTGAGAAATGTRYSPLASRSVTADAIKLDLVARVIIADSPDRDEKMRRVVESLQESINALSDRTKLLAEKIAELKKEKAVADAENKALKETIKAMKSEKVETQAAQTALTVVRDRLPEFTRCE